MAINPVDGIGAYRAALARVQAATEEARAASGDPLGAGGPGGAAALDGSTSPFMRLVQETVQTTIDSNRQAEQIAIDAAAGRADLSDVVTAVANAEATLQTVVTVRDRIIQAYQEILRMPI